MLFSAYARPLLSENIGTATSVGATDQEEICAVYCHGEEGAESNHEEWRLARRYKRLRRKKGDTHIYVHPIIGSVEKKDNLWTARRRTVMDF